MASVELRHLAKRFGALAVVDDVSLRIEHGQLVCLLGPSGCGKTTTLRLIAGFIEPSVGEVVVGNRVLSSPARTIAPEDRRMSMIFQSYALWPHMTVTENIVYGLKMRKVDRAAIASRLSAMLATAKLEALADRYPGELSGGQQQRVALARALIVEPETLLLDEPLSNLDANLREELRFEVRRLHDATNTTTVYVTHDQTEAMSTADIICVMNHGRIEQAGTPQDIYAHPCSEFVARFIGSANVLRGTRSDATHITVAGHRLRVTGDTSAGLVAIRQHEVTLQAADKSTGDNILPATVTRQAFLGMSRDYLVALADGTPLRVIAPASVDIAPGSAVVLQIAPDHCRALPR